MHSRGLSGPPRQRDRPRLLQRGFRLRVVHLSRVLRLLLSGGSSGGDPPARPAPAPVVRIGAMRGEGVRRHRVHSDGARSDSARLPRESLRRRAHQPHRPSAASRVPERCRVWRRFEPASRECVLVDAVRLLSLAPRRAGRASAPASRPPPVCAGIAVRVVARQLGCGVLRVSASWANRSGLSGGSLRPAVRLSRTRRSAARARRRSPPCGRCSRRPGWCRRCES